MTQSAILDPAHSKPAQRDESPARVAEPLSPRARPRPLPADIALALTIVAGATGVRMLLNPWLHDTVPFILLFPALVFIAWLCGRVAYAAAAVAGLIACSVLFMSPQGLFEIDRQGIIQGVLYLAVAAAIGPPAYIARAARARAERSAAEAASAAEALRQSQASAAAHANELQAIMDAVPAIVAIARDPAARSVTGNAAWNELIGQSPAGSAGAYRVVRDGVEVPEDQLPLRAAARTGRTVRDAALEIHRADGTVRSILGHAAPMLDGQGRTRGAVAAFVDVTDLNRAREDFERSEATFRAVFESDVAGLMIWHADGRVLEANNEFLRLLGYTREDLESGRLHWDALTPPEYQADADRRRREVLAGRRTRAIEKEFFRKDGSRVSVLSGGAPLPQAGEGGISFVVDLSRLVGAESALRDSEERFRMVAESAPIIIFSCLPSGECDYLNSRFTQYTGLPRAAAARTAWFSVIHPEDAESARRQWEEATRTGEALTAEHRFRGADGAYRWFSVRAVPIRDGSGGITRWLGCCADVDDIKRAEADLARYSAEITRQAGELARSNADLTDFAHIAAHDLKEPLRGIRHSIAFLIEDEGEKLDAQGLQRLRTTEQLAKRMHDLLEALLVYARMGQGALKTEPADIAAVAADAVASVRSRLADAGAEVLIETSLPTVSCDRLLVCQVLCNLIVNGVKYNTSDVKRIWIGARESDRGGPPVIYVRDNGIGVPAEHAAGIFRIFRRLHGREEFGGGTGAGLAIAKKVVERHGGRIWVEPSPEGGSVFCFTLARTADTDQPPLLVTMPESATLARAGH